LQRDRKTERKGKDVKVSGDLESGERIKYSLKNKTENRKLN